jgi:hypothetical protein
VHSRHTKDFFLPAKGRVVTAGAMVPPGQATHSALSAPSAAGAFDSLYSTLRSASFEGHEFDDLLASPIVNALTRKSLFAKRVAIQLGERVPFDIRGLLRVPKLPSSKARAFIARGLLCRYAADGREQWLHEARSHLDWLETNATREFGGMAWGNHFDFASRGGFYPAGLPTVVWTAHAAQCFAMAHEMTGEARYCRALVGAADFVYSALDRHTDADGTCIGYAPGRLNLVHNSNLLGATTLLRAWKKGAPDAYRQLACDAIRWSLAHQRRDGAWAYGLGPKYRWVDNFHTGYVLDCLVDANAMLGEEWVPSRSVIATLEFWTDRFFDADGRPRYYDNRARPTDIQCCAQAIESGCRAAAWSGLTGDIARRVCDWTLQNMRKDTGAFRYRSGALFANDLESIHWGEATMLSALGHVLALEARDPSVGSARS